VRNLSVENKRRDKVEIGGNGLRTRTWWFQQWLQVCGAAARFREKAAAFLL